MSLPILVILLMVNLLSSEPQSASKNDFCIVFYNVTWKTCLMSKMIRKPKMMISPLTGRITGPIIGWIAKLQHIYKTLIAAGKGEFPDIIGLAEIEKPMGAQALNRQYAAEPGSLWHYS